MAATSGNGGSITEALMVHRSVVVQYVKVFGLSAEILCWLWIQARFYQLTTPDLGEPKIQNIF